MTGAGKISKRNFLQASIFLGCGVLLNGVKAIAASTLKHGNRMPDEAEVHLITWMAFGASRAIWGRNLLPEVQRNLASIANAIVKFEPVNILVRDVDMAAARKLLDPCIKLIACQLDDIWARDTGSVFAFDDMGRKSAIDFNFNGWGGKQTHAQDAKVASFMAGIAGVPRVFTKLVLEGGAIEVDGQGTALMTESCVLNDNRNPGWTKSEIEAELHRLLGIEKAIWLPGVKGQDITDAHIDFYARFVRPGVVVAGFEPDASYADHKLTKANIRLLKSADDAKGRKLEVHVIEGPRHIREKYANDEFAAGYINYYVCNGGIIMSEFGDTLADAAAKSTLQKLYPGREIVQVNADGISAGGGGIHCTTQQEPV